MAVHSRKRASASAEDSDDDEGSKRGKLDDALRLLLAALHVIKTNVPLRPLQGDVRYRRRGGHSHPCEPLPQVRDQPAPQVFQMVSSVQLATTGVTPSRSSSLPAPHLRSQLSRLQDPRGAREAPRVARGGQRRRGARHLLQALPYQQQPDSFAVASRLVLRCRILLASSSLDSTAQDAQRRRRRRGEEQRQAEGEIDLEHRKRRRRL